MTAIGIISAIGGVLAVIGVVVFAALVIGMIVWGVRSRVKAKGGVTFSDGLDSAEMAIVMEAVSETLKSKRVGEAMSSFAEALQLAIQTHPTAVSPVAPSPVATPTVTPPTK